MTTTYTRLEAAQIFGVSNTIVTRNLKAIEALGFSDLIDSDNRLTEKAIELIGLYREKNQAALDAALAAEASHAAAEVTEAEVFGDYPEAVPAGSLTLANACENIAARTGTITLTSSEQYESRAAAAKTALARFVEANNQRGNRLAQNAATARRSFEQLGTEHAIGHLMTYAEALNATLAEGMAAMQTGAVSMADRMGNAAAESVS
jgi:inorganic triphosphatase YgiF